MGLITTSKWQLRCDGGCGSTTHAVTSAIATKQSFIRGCFAHGWVKLERKYLCPNCYEEMKRRRRGGAA